MSIDLSDHQNQLLQRIPKPELAGLANGAQVVQMQLRDVVCEPGEEVPFIYFPTSSMLSSIVVLDADTAVEAATIGREGMGGVAVLVDQRKSPYRVIQQVEGEAVRINADHFQNVMSNSPPLKDLLQRYVFTLLEQCGQNAACNLHHSIDARLSRWLLQTSDRIGRSNFYITQEFLSEMVGASRQTVSSTASALQQAGLIEYSRGNARVVDRRNLEIKSCQCYAAFNDIYEKYMHEPIDQASAN